MKCFFLIVLLMVAMIICFAEAEQQAVVSKMYEIDGDFDKISASNSIQFELTHTDTEPSVYIETEEWLHTDGYITVTTKPHNYLSVKLTDGANNAAIKVHINYRTPLLSLELMGTSSMRSTNALYTNPSSLFNVALAGSSIAILELQHRSNIYVAMSGAGQLSLFGRVQGNGHLSISGTPHLNAIACPMKVVTVELSGTGSASVYGVEGVHASVSGIGSICYRGPLLNSVINGVGSITECISEQTSTEHEHSSAPREKIMDKCQRLIIILATTVLFFFF